MPAFPVASCHQGLLDAFCQKDSWLKKEKTLQRGARLSVLDAELRDGVSQTQAAITAVPPAPGPMGDLIQAPVSTEDRGALGAERGDRVFSTSGWSWHQEGDLQHSTSPS